MKLPFQKTFFITITVLIASFIFSTIKVYAEELKPGRTETTLDADVTYTVKGDVFVSVGATLIIPAGTQLFFAQNGRLVVYGKLIAKGTTKNHIVISKDEESAAKTLTQEINNSEPIKEENIQTPEVVPMSVSMSVEKTVTNNKHGGITFMANSSGSLSYVEIKDAATGITVDRDVVLDASHMMFTNCNTGMTNTRGKVTLTDSTFLDTAFPAQIDVYGTFTHSGTTFLGKGFKGWNYGGDILQGQNYHFNSRDGEYYVFGITVLNGGTLTIDYGITVFIQDGFSINVAQGGTLVVNGTEASPVNVYGDGTCPLNMSSIILAANADSKIKYTNFHNLCSAIKATASGVSVTHSNFKDISGTAIIAEQQGDLTITNSDFTTSKIALVLNNPVIKNITNNYFHGNTIGVSVIDMVKAVIKNNGWGSDSGPTIKSNSGGKGDSIITKNTTEVIYKPWLGMKDEPTTTEAPVVTPPTADQNPIIIVPGITGSILTKDYGDKSELWPNIAKLALSPTDSYLNDLELLQTGIPSTVRPMVVGDIVRSASSVDIFNSMINALHTKGYIEGANLFVFPYDWRLSNTVNQSLLKDMIAKALLKSGKKKVTIIAHSMGGLLVKEYISENPTAPLDHLFYIAVPHLGAPKTFKTLMYGDDMGFRFSLGSLLQVPVLNEQRVKTITQNMPSVYELLPSKKYIDGVSHYIQDRTQVIHDMSQDNIEKYMIADGRNDNMFSFAHQLHDKIDTMTSTFDKYDFAGCGNTKTITGFTLTKEQSLTLTGFKLIPEHRLLYGSGDGVVPVSSAVAENGAHNYYVHAGSHGTVASLPVIQDTIVQILDGKAPTTNNDISTMSTQCNLAGDTIDVHSPVMLNVYDELGRHTGPTIDGGIEYGIPNVQYDVIDDEKFVFLPTGPKYKITQQAQSAGLYDMYISHSDESDIVTHQTYYHAVPLLSDKTLGTITLSKENSSPSITIDDNNDGTIDRTVEASSSLEEKQAKDSVVPITTATYADGLVTLKATDDNAGILNTKYSTDNIVWQIYDKPFATSVGSTVYFVSIDRAGNTEEIKQLKVESGGSTSTIIPTTTTAPIATSSGNNVSVSMQSSTVTPTDTDGSEENVNNESSDDILPDAEDIKTPLKKKTTSTTILTAPAPDEGTIMSDPEVTLKGLSASAAGVTALGPGKVIVLGLLAIGALVIMAVFSKKRS
ncbi:MAG: hypothetical protein ABIO57_03150 [Candidatus Paceibacterota bacterium]